MRLKTLSFQQYIDSGISPATAGFITNELHPIIYFDIWCSDVDWDYAVPPMASNPVPLWSYNEDLIARWTICGISQFIFSEHDSQYFRLISYTEQGVLAYLFKNYYESGRDDFIEFSKYIGFNNVEMAIQVLSENCEEYSDWMLNLQ